MQTLTEAIFKLDPPGGFFDSTVVINLFPDLSYGAIKAIVYRSVAKKEIIRIIPGLYCLAKEFRRSELHPFVVAGMLRPSSHISLESALSFHGLIPEAVYQVSSVITERSKTFHSPMGLFSFHRVPVKVLHAGIKTIELGQNTWAFIADPFRAIADLVYLRKNVSWKEDGMDFLTESMRIDLDDLFQIPHKNLEAVIDAFSNKRTQGYLNGLRMEMFL